MRPALCDKDDMKTSIGETLQTISILILASMILYFSFINEAQIDFPVTPLSTVFLILLVVLRFYMYFQDFCLALKKEKIEGINDGMNIAFGIVLMSMVGLSILLIFGVSAYKVILWVIS